MMEDDGMVYYSTRNETIDAKNGVTPTSMTPNVNQAMTSEEDDDYGITYEMINKNIKPSPPPQGAKNPELVDLTSPNRIYANEGSTGQGPVTSDAIYQNTPSTPNSPTGAPPPNFDGQRKASNASSVGVGTLTRDLKLVLQQRLQANQQNERF